MPSTYWAVQYPPFQPGKRKPRQLPGRGRRFAARKSHSRPQSNPTLAQIKAAQTIQRKFRQKRYVPKKPISQGTEVFQYRLSPQAAVSLQAIAASNTNGPKNSFVFLPAGFSQHSTMTDNAGSAYTLHGSFLKPVLGWVSKFRVSFDAIANHADNKQGLNLRCHHGVMKITATKFSDSPNAYGSQEEFEDDCMVAVKAELFQHNLCADHLEYAQKNRNIKVNGSFAVRPNRNSMIRMDMTEDSATSSLNSFNVPPPVLLTINHPVPKMKTKIARTTDTSFPVLTNLWVPWVCFTCEQLTSNSGHFKIEQSSRMYFTDN